jgi:hypothetical protein
MIELFCFVLAVLGLPFKSKLRLACRQATHLTPNRLATLTPSTALEVAAAAKENGQLPGSCLGADKGQSSEPFHTGEQMACQICGRMTRAKQGIIAYHGYKRPWDGYQTASCIGAQHSPFEVSNEVLLGVIRDHEQRVARITSHLDRVCSGELPVIATVKPHWREKRTEPFIHTFTPKT